MKKKKPKLSKNSYKKKKAKAAKAAAMRAQSSDEDLHDWILEPRTHEDHCFQETMIPARFIAGGKTRSRKITFPLPRQKVSQKKHQWKRTISNLKRTRIRMKPI